METIAFQNFKNSFGEIKGGKVCIGNINEDYSFTKIAFIELKKQKKYFGRSVYFVQIIFTNATSKISEVKRSNLIAVKDFIRCFRQLRNKYPQLD